MTNNDFGLNLLSLFAQLTPWVQAVTCLGLYLAVVGVVYLFKESVAALMQPFLRFQSPQKAPEDPPAGKCQQLHLEILKKLDRLLTRDILSGHLGIR